VARLTEKLADNLVSLGDKAHRFLEAYERVEKAEDVSPYAYDRLRQRAFELRRELERLGLP
jgi:hypothetical protein